MTTYRVTAPMVNVEVPSRAMAIGQRLISGQTAFYAGNILPPDVPQDLLDRFLATGAIEPVPE